MSEMNTSASIPNTNNIGSMTNMTSSPSGSSLGAALAKAKSVTTESDTDAIIPDRLGTTDSFINDKELVEQTIAESSDLVTALEAVGAMYRIPSTCVLSDDSLKRIKVVNEHIIAPPIKNVKGNTKAIMCAIGSVLDYISQRVDDKLTSYQNINIQNNKLESTRREANPSKGEVVGRYFDNNNDEIIVYDTGLVDAAFSQEARDKIEELRREGKIPNNDKMNNKPSSGISYFSDEDDISANIDMTADNIDNTLIDTSTQVDIASDIQEESFHIDMIDYFNGTTHLGYELLQEQGFDYIKPTQAFIQEAVKTKKKKQTDIIKTEDIKYMKFDNTNIIKAIKFMNKARAEQSGAHTFEAFDVKQLMGSTGWNKAIECLNRQFNMLLNVRWVNEKDGSYNAYTFYPDDYEVYGKVTVSKSKGFQFGGQPITIYDINGGLLAETIDDDPKIFGQSIIATMMHEIFHNIAFIMRQEEYKFNATLGTTIAAASSAETGKAKRIIIQKYVDVLNKQSGNNMNRIMRRSLVKQISYMVAAQHDARILKVIQSVVKSEKDPVVDADKQMDDLINQYEKIVGKEQKMRDKEQRRYDSKFSRIMGTVLLVIGGITSVIIIGLPILCIGMKLRGHNWRDVKLTKKYEEYYCDLFASMYNLPVTQKIYNLFSMTDVGHINDVKKEKIEKLQKLEKVLYDILDEPHTTTSERNLASVKIAKSALESGEKLDPVIKDYLQWVIKNHDNILDANIESNYRDNVFDPKYCEDLDNHLQRLIDGGDLHVTEYVKPFLSNDMEEDNIITESKTDKRLNDKGDAVPDICPKCGSKIGIFLKGEPVYLCTNKGCEKYFGTVPCESDKSKSINEYSSSQLFNEFLFFNKKKKKDIIDSKHPELLKQVILKIAKDTEKPCASLHYAKDNNIKFDDSFIGGKPGYIPKGTKIDKDEYVFIQQINCSELSFLKDFPHTGILSFWTNPTNYDDGKCFYFPDTNKPCMSDEELQSFNSKEILDTWSDHGVEASGKVQKLEIKPDTDDIFSGYSYDDIFIKTYKEMAEEQDLDSSRYSDSINYEQMKEINKLHDELIPNNLNDCVGKMGGYDSRIQDGNHITSTNDKETLLCQLESDEIILWVIGVVHISIYPRMIL